MRFSPAPPLACLVLGACAGDPAQPPTGDAPAEADPALTQDKLPVTLLGTYDVDQQACAATTTMTRLALSPDTLRFYYGYATVDLDPSAGGLRLDGAGDGRGGDAVDQAARAYLKLPT